MSATSKLPNDTAITVKTPKSLDTISKKVISIAYRPKQGPTGGPGGVLFVQEKILGKKIDNNVDLEYRYKNDKHISQNKYLSKIFSKLISKLIIRNEHWHSIRWAYTLAKEHDSTYFIAHEPISAFGLALARCKYSLIYHQQGSLVTEQESFTKQKSFDKIISCGQKLLLNLIEAWAFRNAYRVYFPSFGAKKVYMSTSKVFQLIPPNFSMMAAYNTILEDNEDTTQADRVILDSIETSGHIFLSVGALTDAKGIDQVPSFLDKFRKLTHRDFTWIVVGVGPLESSLRQKIEKFGLQENVILINKRLSHPAILKLMESADTYIMLHRRAIFDFATLEAMRASCSIVLSDVDGNPEFNLENNVFLIGENNLSEVVEQFSQADLKAIGRHNKDIFYRKFGPEEFIHTYQKIIYDLIDDI